MFSRGLYRGVKELEIAPRGHDLLDLHDLKKHPADLNAVSDFRPLDMIHNTTRVGTTHHHITDFVNHKCWRLDNGRRVSFRVLLPPCA